MRQVIFLILFISAYAYASFIQFKSDSIQNGPKSFSSYRPRIYNRKGVTLRQAKPALLQHARIPVRSLSSRIYGGQIATPHSSPYMVALFIDVGENDLYFCGGTLISRQYVMTAAHCAEGATKVTVILGAQDLSTYEKTQVRLIATGCYIHENWNNKTLVNDIALIQLPTNVTLNDNIQLTTLPTRAEANNMFVNVAANVSGWGLVRDSSRNLSPLLRYANVKIISNAQCYRTYGYIPNTEVCTVGVVRGSFCEGDSGGPLTINNTQVGIVSYGTQTCEQNYPDVYTRLTPYLDWLSIHAGVVIS